MKTLAENKPLNGEHPGDFIKLQKGEGFSKSNPYRSHALFRKHLNCCNAEVLMLLLFWLHSFLTGNSLQPL